MTFRSKHRLHARRRRKSNFTFVHSYIPPFMWPPIDGVDCLSLRCQPLCAQQLLCMLLLMLMRSSSCLCPPIVLVYGVHVNNVDGLWLYGGCWKLVAHNATNQRRAMVLGTDTCKQNDMDKYYRTMSWYMLRSTCFLAFNVTHIFARNFETHQNESIHARAIPCWLVGCVRLCA